jgi:hypothetical protein
LEHWRSTSCVRPAAGIHGRLSCDALARESGGGDDAAAAPEV